MRKICKYINILLLAIVLISSSCNFTRDRDLGEAIARDIHEKYNSADYENIYKLTSNSFKSTTNKQVFLKMFNDMNSLFGKYKSHKIAQWKVNKPYGGNTKIELTLTSVFENKICDEEFVLHVEDNNILLDYYSIYEKK